MGVIVVGLENLNESTYFDDCGDNFFSLSELCDGDAGIKNKRNDIIWISYENPEFKTDHGQVWYVPKSAIENKAKQNQQSDDYTY